MWFFLEGIANIPSLSHVKEKFRVTFNCASDNSFHVYKPDETLIFHEATRRLYYFDTVERDEELSIFITTVNENKSSFLAYDFSRAEIACSIQCRIGRP